MTPAANVLGAFELLGNLPALLCVCRGGQVEAMNRFGAAMLGLASPEDAIGQPFETFLATEYQGFGDELLEMIAGETDGTRLRVAKSAAPTTDLEIRAVMRNRLENGLYVLYGTDISEKIRDVELLYQRERRYRSIIENAGGMICETEDGMIVGVNAAGQRLLGLGTEVDVLGHPLHHLFHPDYRDLFECELQALSREDSPVPVPLVRADGDFRDVEVIVTSLDGETARHLLVEIRDITAQNQAMQALRALNETLEARVEERTRSLQEAQQRLSRISRLEAIGTFAGGIAHEINTPIQFLADNLKFLRDSVSDLQEIVSLYQAVDLAVTENRDPRQPLDTVRQTSKDRDIDFILEEAPLAISQSMAGVSHVAKVVQAMRDFADRRELAPAQVDLSAVVGMEIQKLRTHFGDGANLRWEPPAGPIPADAAADELSQVIRNVVDNAVQAVQGTGRQDGRIDVTLKRDGAWAILTVRDNGVGMDGEVSSRAFDPFFTTREVGAGIGQGLAVAHHIVTDRHGGEIALNSAPGKGCCVTVKLPCQPATSECLMYEATPVGHTAA